MAVIEPVGVRFESQRHEQLAQRASLAGDESDREIRTPGIPHPDDSPTSRTSPEHSGRREPFELRGIQIARAVEVGGDSAVQLDAGALLDQRPKLPGL